jgi:hypothetical protein
MDYDSRPASLSPIASICRMRAEPIHPELAVTHRTAGLTWHRLTIVGASVRTCGVCRSDVPSRAEPAVARLIKEIAQALADEAHIDVASIRIGPVDFGEPKAHGPAASP